MFKITNNLVRRQVALTNASKLMYSSQQLEQSLEQGRQADWKSFFQTVSAEDVNSADNKQIAKLMKGMSFADVQDYEH